MSSDDIDSVPSLERGDGAPDGIADFTNAMSHLKPRERAMLWLAYAEGASHREIAEVLGLQARQSEIDVVSRAAKAGGAVKSAPGAPENEQE